MSFLSRESGADQRTPIGTSNHVVLSGLADDFQIQGYPKIRKLDVASLCCQNVGCFQIAMHDLEVRLSISAGGLIMKTHILRVKEIQAFENFANISGNKLLIEWSKGFDGMSERTSFDESARHLSAKVGIACLPVTHSSTMSSLSSLLAIPRYRTIPGCFKRFKRSTSLMIWPTSSAFIP